MSLARLIMGRVPPSTISSPRDPLHVTHVEIDESGQITGLPKEWGQTLIASGEIDEKHVIVGWNGYFRLRDVPRITGRNNDNSKITNHSYGPNKRNDDHTKPKPLPKDSPNISNPPKPALPSLSSNDLRQPPIEIARICGLYSECDQQRLIAREEPLGHGSLGFVQEVRVSDNYPSFVRKRVRLPYPQRRKYVRSAEEEVKVLSKLSHCHIVKVIGNYQEVLEDGRQFYTLLMAPVGEGNLKDYLEKVDGYNASGDGGQWHQKKDQLSTWFRCLATALTHIHSNGIRHQDIKPSNIIYRGETIYFTDFGSAARFHSEQTTSTFSLTRTTQRYCAPEVINNINNNDEILKHGRGSDIFALGAVFSEMLVVYRGLSLEDYHWSLAQGSDSPLLYGEKIEDITAFFHEDLFFDLVVEPMLNPERKKRPDAQTVVKMIRAFGVSYWNLAGCDCNLAGCDCDLGESALHNLQSYI